MDTIGDIIFRDEIIGRGRPELIHLQFENPKELLERGFKHFVGEGYKWQPEYDAIADWMADNKGLGLFMHGGCGRGKSVIGEQILPQLISWRHRKILNCYSYRQLNKKLEEIKLRKLVYLDDVGQETVGKEYGNTIYAFADIVDNAEKYGNLLVISTNLTMGQLKEKYGERVLSRLRGLTKSVGFVGDDLRWNK